MDEFPPSDSDIMWWMKRTRSQEGRTFNASVYSQKDRPGLDILLFVAEEAPIVLFFWGFFCLYVYALVEHEQMALPGLLSVSSDFCNAGQVLISQQQDLMSRFRSQLQLLYQLCEKSFAKVR